MYVFQGLLHCYKRGVGPLTICMLGSFLIHFCCRLLTFFQNKLFLSKNRSGTLSECQRVYIQIRTDIMSVRTDIMSVLIWVQTVCKGYQQTTQVVNRKRKVKNQQHYVDKQNYFFLNTNWAST